MYLNNIHWQIMPSRLTVRRKAKDNAYGVMTIGMLDKRGTIGIPKEFYYQQLLTLLVELGFQTYLYDACGTNVFIIALKGDRIRENRLHYEELLKLDRPAIRTPTIDHKACIEKECARLSKGNHYEPTLVLSEFAPGQDTQQHWSKQSTLNSNKYFSAGINNGRVNSCDKVRVYANTPSRALRKLYNVLKAMKPNPYSLKYRWFVNNKPIRN